MFGAVTIKMSGRMGIDQTKTFHLGLFSKKSRKIVARDSFFTNRTSKKVALFFEISIP
jgi:hypothetical protein